MLCIEFKVSLSISHVWHLLFHCVIYHFILAIAVICFLHYLFFFLPTYFSTLVSHLTDTKNYAGYEVLHLLMFYGHWQKMLNSSVIGKGRYCSEFCFHLCWFSMSHMSHREAWCWWLEWCTHAQWVILQGRTLALEDLLLL